MKKYILIATLFFAGFYFTGFSQNEKIKTVFIYNFTKYISWPQSENSGDFKIGVLGSSAMSNSLNALSQKKMVGNRKIKVLSFNSVDAVQKCHILFVSDTKNSQLSKVIAKVRLLPIVVVTESSGSIQKGAGINFKEVGGKQKFEIKKSAVEKNGIKVNSALLKLGV